MTASQTKLTAVTMTIKRSCELKEDKVCAGPSYTVVLYWENVEIGAAADSADSHQGEQSLRGGKSTMSKERPRLLPPHGGSTGSENCNYITSTYPLPGSRPCTTSLISASRPYKEALWFPCYNQMKPPWDGAHCMVRNCDKAESLTRDLLSQKIRPL